MTITPTTPPAVTDSDIRPDVDVEKNGEDTPRAGHARARGIVTRCSVEFQQAARVWWVITTRPMSLRDAWDAAHTVDVKRVPLRKRWLLGLWRWDARLGTGLILFAAAALLAAGVGPLLWLAARPSRRVGALAAAALLGFAVYAAGHR